LGKYKRALGSYDQALQVNPEYDDALVKRQTCIEIIQGA